MEMERINVRARHSALLLAYFALFCLVGCRSERLQNRDNGLSSKTEWIDPKSLSSGPIQHGELSAEQMKRIKALQETFHEVDPTPLEKWVEDFKRDNDPEREIRVYESMAEAYRAYCAGKNLTLQAKMDVEGVVLMRSGASDEEVLSQLKLKTLSIEDAKAILKLYKAPPAPIDVYSKPGGK